MKGIVKLTLSWNTFSANTVEIVLQIFSRTTEKLKIAQNFTYGILCEKYCHILGFLYDVQRSNRKKMRYFEIHASNFNYKDKTIQYSLYLYS